MRGRRQVRRVKDADRTQRSVGRHRSRRSARARSALPRVGRLCVRSWALSDRLLPSKGAAVLRRYMKTLLFAFGLRFRAHRYREREKIDEAFGVFGVVAAHGEAGQIGAI